MRTFREYFENPQTQIMNYEPEWMPVKSSHGVAYAKRTEGGYYVATDKKGSHKAFVSDFNFGQHWQMA
jgi:hypothetical protein